MLEKTYSNGFELLVSPTSAPVIALQLWVDVGSIDEKPQEAGFCHFLEHMLFKGTPRRSTAEIAGSIEGAGGEMNAFTSFEYTVFHITISNKKWELALDILSDIAQNCNFAGFDPEKAVILEEMSRNEDSPDRKLYMGAYKLMYGTSGYGRPIIGNNATVQRCTKDHLKQFWKRWYVPNLMTLVICGDVEESAVEKKVKKLWEDYRNANAPRGRRRSAQSNIKMAAPTTSRAQQPFPIHSVRWVGLLPACTLKDKVLPSLDMASMILGQGGASRLHERLYRQEKVVSSVGSYVWTPLGPGLFAFDVESPLAKPGHFRKLLWEEVKNFCSEGPTSSELERAKAIMESERIYSTQTVDGLANRLGFLKTTLNNTYFDLEYLNQIRELTTQDVREAANTYLLESVLREYVLLPQDFEQLKFWDGVELGKPVKPPAPIKKKSSLHSGESYLLANGIELFLFPKSDTPLVSLQACVLGGLRKENRKNAGLSNVLAEVWEKGPQGWEPPKFVEFFEKRGSHLEAFSGRNSIGLSATMLTRYVSDIVPLFIDTFFNPSLLEHEFDLSKSLALEEVRTLEDDLTRLVSRVFSETLFSGHPYSFPVCGYEDSVSGLQCIDLKEYLKGCLNNQKIIVAASGKMNPQHMISFFEKKVREYTQATPDGVLQTTPFLASKVVEIQKNREQSHLLLGFRGTQITDPTHYDLKILITILGGQSGRLFTELRDKKGLCYTVSPVFFEGIEPGFVGVYIGCEPSKRQGAIQGIRDELQKLKEKTVSSSELTRAKEYVLGRHNMEMQLNGSIASTVAFNALYGLGFNEHLFIEERMKKVTASSIQKLSQKLFNSPELLAVIV